MIEEGNVAGSERVKTPARSLDNENQTATPLQQHVAFQDWERILESIGDGFWVLDRSWRCTYLNNRQAQLVEMPKEDVLGKNIWELFPDLINTEFYRQLHQAVSEQMPIHFEDLCLVWQGWFEIRAYPSANGISILTLEITQHKQTQEVLQDSEQQLKIALQTAKLGAWEHDLVTGRLSCSPQCKANFGLPPDAEFTHQTLFAALHPEDRDRVNCAIQRAITEQTDYEVEERCFWPDGSLHWLIARGRLVYDSNGTPVRMVGVTLDITERKQFEESLKTAHQQISNILESITDAFVAFDRQWRYTYVNQEAARLLQRSPQELLGRCWQDVFPDVERLDPQLYHQMHRAVDEQVTVKFESFSFVSNCWVEISIFPFSEGLAVHFRDISDRKREERRKAAQYGITRVLAEATTLAEAVPAILQSLCTSLDWQLGIIWSVDYRNNVLRYVNSWQAPAANVQEFIEANQQTIFARGGGLPGRIWQKRQPIWIPEPTNDTNFPRSASAARGKLHTAFGFPIQLGEEILGVIECFSDCVQEPDEDLLDMMAAIGSQIGQFMERKRTQEALRESQELFESFMKHSPATAFIKDEAGRYIYVNQLVEQIFNRPLAQWIGRTDFELFGTAAAQLWRENDLTVIATGQTLTRVEAVPLEDGEHTYMSFKFPLQSSIERQLVAGMSIDITERIRAEEAFREQERRYRYIFEAVGVSIWEEDFSEIKRAIDRLKAQGVQDFRQYFAEHPDFVQQAIGMVRLIDVNPATLQMFKAQDKHELLTSLERVFVPETLEVFIGELVAIAEGKTFFEAETILKTLQGEQLNVIFTLTLPPPTAKFDSVLVSIMNITDHKRAEEALRQSEERFQLVAQATNDVMWDFNVLTNEMWWSERVQLLFGYQPEEFGSNMDGWVQRVHPDDIERVQSNYEMHLNSTASFWSDEYRFRRADGSYAYLLDRAYIIRDTNGSPVRVLGAMIDISDRKQAEDALRKSERLYRAIGETINYGIWVCEPNGRNTYTSESFLRLVGLTQEQCSEFGWGDVLHPDDAARTMAAWKECAQSGNLWDIEHRFRGVDGNWHPILARGIPVRDEDGEIICWAGINLDISRLKRVEAEFQESEGRFRALIEHAPDAIFIANMDGTYIDVNTSACQMLGYERDELIGKQIIDIIPPEDWQQLAEFKASLLEGHTRVGEWTILRKDGSPVPVEVSTKTLPDGRCQAFIRDITERKRAEQERERLLEQERVAREQAEAANRIKDEFLAVLSHELRSPLNPILGWTKLLRTRKFNEQAMDKALETIERNAKLQTQLIEDLLDVSRILRGKMVLNVCPVNLASTIEAAIETVRLAAQTKGIQIQTQLDCNVGSVSGDPSRLQQIVWNLLSNAVKFTPSGGRVEVRLQELKVETSENNLQPATSYAQILVKDTGKGISPEFLPHVFEYFRQENSTTTRTFGGLGLGLAIVRHLTELHGGTVQAESLGEGQGATFTVLLPQKVTLSKSSSTHEPSTTPEDLSGLQVLVVDDEADMRDLALVILSEYGANVKVAASAAEALLVLEEFKPDVLISDIGMPDVDGYMLMRQIRTMPSEQGGKIPAIALTAYAGEINQQQALAAGFQMHVSKPVEPAELVKAIIELSPNFHS